MDNDKPVFRHPDLYQELPWRKWLRDNVPNGKAGFVFEDLDLIVRWYGEADGGSPDGHFMLVEIKKMGARLGFAQQKTFGLIHRLLRKGDPQREFYLGFYLVHWEDEGVRVNDFPLSFAEFKEFMMGRYRILSLFDSHRIGRLEE